MVRGGLGLKMGHLCPSLLGQRAKMGVLGSFSWFADDNFRMFRAIIFKFGTLISVYRRKVGIENGHYQTTGSHSVGQ